MSGLPRLRFLHSTIQRKNMLVGPPDPVSNLRPVLYNGLPDQTKTNAYSPQELRAHPIDPNKFELDLASQRIDKLNHEFWTESNRRFHQSQEIFLNSRKARLKLAKTPEERERMEQEHHSEFYASWVQLERHNQLEYTSKWLRAQYGLIWSTAQMTWDRWLKKILPL